MILIIKGSGKAGDIPTRETWIKVLAINEQDI
jgi:hypothetical protein